MKNTLLNDMIESDMKESKIMNQHTSPNHESGRIHRMKFPYENSRDTIKKTFKENPQ